MRVATAHSLHHPRRLRLHGEGARPVRAQERAWRARGRPRPRQSWDRHPRRMTETRRIALNYRKPNPQKARRWLSGTAAAAASLGLAFVHPVAAQRLPVVEADHYARCMAKARQTPPAAWEDSMGGRAARGGQPAE